MLQFHFGLLACAGLSFLLASPLTKAVAVDGMSPLRLACGASGPIADPNGGPNWQPDAPFSAAATAGTVWKKPLPATSASDLAYSQASDLPPSLFDKARRPTGSLTYFLPAPPGAYVLYLYFMESQKNVAPGRRVFNVYVQGRLLRYNLDIVSAAGASRIPLVLATALTVTTPALNSNSTVTVFFERVRSRPLVAGLALLPLVGTTASTAATLPSGAANPSDVSSTSGSDIKNSTVATTTTRPTPSIAPLGDTPMPAGKVTLSNWGNVPGAMPGGKDFREAMGLAFEDYYYLFGGFDGSSGSSGWNYMLPTAWRYSAVTMAWTLLPDIPIIDGVTHSGQVVRVSTRTIYLVGGYALRNGYTFQNWPSDVACREVWALDLNTLTWSVPFSLPAPRGAGAAALLEDRYLHFAGGATMVWVNGKKHATDYSDHWVIDLDNPGTGWSTRAKLPLARNHVGSVALNGYMYALGGQLKEDEWKMNQPQVDRYDAATDTWTPVEPLPLPLGHITPSIAVYHGRILVVSGTTTNAAHPKSILAYTPGFGWSAVGKSPPYGYASQVVGILHVNGTDKLYVSGFKVFYAGTLSLGP
jgi:hypothetical protein